MELVAAEDVFTGATSLVPIDRVLMPVNATIYGCDTNGLSSGNSVLEATVHGLAELVERDVEAFLLVKDTSTWVRNDTLPEPLANIARSIEARGLMLHVRYHADAYRLPFFLAVLLERGARDGVWTGLGLHPSSAIAAARAITEAVQSRLTIIHGGRDDLGPHMEKFAKLTERERSRFHDQVADFANPGNASMSFADAIDRSDEVPSVEAALSLLAQEVRSVGLERILRVRLTPDDSPLAVVRVIVPGLEFSYLGHGQRLGHRLIAALARTARS
jgi:ribosomal protein S12 methylthiotransferase accessory factor